MENTPRKIKILYFAMFRLMDLESILWDIGEFLIKPIATLRRKVAEIINNHNNNYGKRN